MDDGTFDVGSNSKGILVFEFRVTRNLLRITANPTFDCNNPNLAPEKKKNSSIFLQKQWLPDRLIGARLL